MAEQDFIWYSLKELAVALIKKNQIHEGHHELSIEFQVAIAVVGPTIEDVAPGAVVSAKRIGLKRVAEPNPMTVDAAEVNPPPKGVAQKRVVVAKREVLAPAKKVPKPPVTATKRAKAAPKSKAKP